MLNNKDLSQKKSSLVYDINLQIGVKATHELWSQWLIKLKSLYFSKQEGKKKAHFNFVFTFTFIQF